jgi:hypothetical protein
MSKRPRTDDWLADCPVDATAVHAFLDWLQEHGMCVAEGTHDAGTAHVLKPKIVGDCVRCPRPRLSCGEALTNGVCETCEERRRCTMERSERRHAHNIGRRKDDPDYEHNSDSF